jgi:hypothetical protein
MTFSRPNSVPEIIYDKFHIMQHANGAVDEVRRAEFYRKGGPMRGVVKGKRRAVAEPLGEPGYRQTAAAEFAVCAQPAGDESVPAQREPGPAVDL